MVLQLCYLVNNFTQWHAKIDLNFIITSPHYKMDFGRGDVLGILTCPFRMGAPQEPTLCVQRGPVPRAAYLHLGCQGMGQGRTAQGWGTQTSLCRQVWYEWPPQPGRGFSVCACACLHRLQKVAQKSEAACGLWQDCGYLLWLISILNVLFKITSSLHIIKESIHNSNPDLA